MSAFAITPIAAVVQAISPDWPKTMNGNPAAMTTIATNNPSHPTLGRLATRLRKYAIPTSRILSGSNIWAMTMAVRSMAGN
ncbi:hypothetical protein [Mesorhizobium sp. NZP2298]|uniref:hypothetical protein n=1 Tax=Mesorhizobium sp. NZP2298 TaxID=2483403 RepID=UPI00155246D8|nr:hypothetical protein [Mesorhizobium sp. NZP2298]